MRPVSSDDLDGMRFLEAAIKSGRGLGHDDVAPLPRPGGSSRILCGCFVAAEDRPRRYQSARTAAPFNAPRPTMLDSGLSALGNEFLKFL